MKTILALLLSLGMAIVPGVLSAQDLPNDVKAKLDLLVKDILKQKEDLSRAKAQLAVAATADQAKLEAAATAARAEIVRALSSRLDVIGKHALLSSIEQKQINKQVGAPGGTGGTNIASKGTTPRLIGLGVENGAFQRSVAGTAITISGNPTGILTALAKKDFIKASELASKEEALRFLRRFSFSATYDISKGAQPNTFTANEDQLIGWSGRIELINRRDPRAKRYKKDWDEFTERAKPLSGAGATFFFALETNARWNAWKLAAASAIENAATAEVAHIVDQQLELGRSIIKETPGLMAGSKRVGDLMDEYVEKRNELIERIAHAPVWTFEYNNIHQFLKATETGPKPPDLSNLKFVYTRQVLGDSEFTWNLSSTLFNYRPKRADGTRIGVLRDVQTAAQVDIALPEILNLGKGVLTFAGLGMFLNQDALGQKIQINGKDVKGRGWIGTGQVKLAFPVTDGIKIPIAVTYASRTELLPDKSDVRGNIGITFDVDKLFAKGK